MKLLRCSIAFFVALVCVLLSSASIACADEKQVCSATAEEAQTHRTDGKLVVARTELVRCAQQSCPKVVRDACAGWLDELDAELPSIVLRAVDAAGNDIADAHVDAAGAPLAAHIDGKAIPLDPGAVTLRFVAPGFVEKKLEIVVARGERSRVVRVVLQRSQADGPTATIATKASQKGGTTTVPGWVLLGSGLATLTAFGVLEGVAHSEYDDLLDGCGKKFTCTTEQTAPARSKFSAAAVTLAAGLTLATAGTTWLVVVAATSPKSKEAAPGASVSLRAGPSGVSLTGRF